MKAADEWNGDLPKETVWRNYKRERMYGGLSGIPLKVLLYDDLMGVVTSRHVTKMAVTPFDPHTSRLYQSLHGTAELL